MNATQWLNEGSVIDLPRYDNMEPTGTDELISLELCMQFLKTLTGLQSKGNA